MTSFIVLFIAFLIIIVADIEPLAKQFFVCLVKGFLASRIVWIFESQLLYYLMFGYELDRGMNLKKTEKSVYEVLCCQPVKVGLNDEPPTSSMALSPSSFGTLDHRRTPKGMEKYSQLRNKAELDAEIARARDELQHCQRELACLENMVFASEHDSKHSEYSSRRGSKQSVNEKELTPVEPI